MKAACVTGLGNMQMSLGKLIGSSQVQASGHQTFPLDIHLQPNNTNQNESKEI